MWQADKPDKPFVRTGWGSLAGLGRRVLKLTVSRGRNVVLQKSISTSCLCMYPQNRCERRTSDLRDLSERHSHQGPA